MNERYLIQLDRSTDKQKHVLTVVLVSDRIDRYNTIIEPEGCVTDFRNVVVDYNHNGKSTGARLKNKRMEKLELDDGTIVNALVGDIEVYKDSVLRDKQGEEVSNAYDSVENGKIVSVSVEFEPIENEIFVNDKSGVTRFRKWSLRKLSLLDVVPGQEDSIILNIRSKDKLLNTNTMERSYVNAVLKDSAGELYAVTKLEETAEVKTLTITNKDGMSKTIDSSVISYDFVEGEEGDKEYCHAGMSDIFLFVANMITSNVATRTVESDEPKEAATPAEVKPEVAPEAEVTPAEPTVEPVNDEAPVVGPESEPAPTVAPEGEAQPEDTKRSELETENDRLARELAEEKEKNEKLRLLVNSPTTGEINVNATPATDMSGGEGVTDPEEVNLNMARKVSKDRW